MPLRVNELAVFDHEHKFPALPLFNGQGNPEPGEMFERFGLTERTRIDGCEADAFGQLMNLFLRRLIITRIKQRGGAIWKFRIRHDIKADRVERFDNFGGLGHGGDMLATRSFLYFCYAAEIRSNRVGAIDYDLAGEIAAVGDGIIHRTVRNGEEDDFGAFGGCANRSFTFAAFGMIRCKDDLMALLSKALAERPADVAGADDGDVHTAEFTFLRARSEQAVL